MEADEMVLSDVHVGPIEKSKTRNLSSTDYEVKVSRFELRLPSEGFSENETTSLPKRPPKAAGEDGGSGHVICDADGDLVVPRKRKRSVPSDVLYIEHSMATRLKDVGLQVWNGCLFLCDYILTNRDTFSNKTVLELGCGVGFCGIVTASLARKVICTEKDRDILELCERNFERNEEFVKGRGEGGSDKWLSRYLDWTEDVFRETPDPFGWRQDDLDLLKSIDVIIAADVIYDVNATEALFKTIYNLMTKYNVRTTLISLEKRLNFTLEDKEVTCPAYQHFLACVEDIDGECHTDSEVEFSVSRVNVNIPHCFHYERSKYLELWKIETMHTKT